VWNDSVAHDISRWVGGCAKEWIGLPALREIRGALHGKPLDPATGAVIHDGTATTPHLRLAVGWYESETAGFRARAGAAELFELVDVVNVFSFQYDGNQTLAGVPCPAAWEYGQGVAAVREMVKALAPEKPQISVVGGAYLGQGSVRGDNHRWCSIAAFRTIFSTMVELYDSGEVEGMFWFSATELSYAVMNESTFRAWALPSLLEELYWPWIGGWALRVCACMTRPARPSMVRWRRCTTGHTTRR
jgi:hypothetical protein